MKSTSVYVMGVVAWALGSAHAGALRTWCGPSGEQDWSASENWVDGLVAMTNDTACFPQNNAYHSNGTGKRRYWFKVTPPEGFTGTILTTNEVASKDYYNGNSDYNQSFIPTVELGVLDSASWTVKGDGGVVATDGIAARLGTGFAGLIEVRKGVHFVPPVELNSAVRIIGAGSIGLSNENQLRQVESFAGDVTLPSGGSVFGATLGAFQSANVKLADGQTLSFDSRKLCMRPVTRIESFVDEPEKWTFNGTTYEQGNIPSGPFNPDPPYVRDGELWLTDEPAQIHSVLYTNRTFRITDDWGMKFRYYPELPSGTRITAEPRADGKGRSHCISGNFAFFLSAHSPTNVGRKNSDGSIKLVDKAYGFHVDLYRDDPKAKVSWVVNGEKSSFRSMYEDELGVKLNEAMDITVSMIRGTMTVTLAQKGKSVSFSHDFSVINKKCAKGAYIGFAAYTGWWGESSASPWARNRISNFSAWYAADTEGQGWVAADDVADFSIADSSNWAYRKVVRTSATSETTNNASMFSSEGVRLTDSVASNASVMISKKTMPSMSVPFSVKCKYKTENVFWTADANAYISFLLGQRNDSTYSFAAKWQGSYYYNYFGNWGGGIDLVWDVNYGSTTVSYSYHDTKNGRRTTASKSESLGVVGSSLVAATAFSEKELEAQLIWDSHGSLKFVGSVFPASGDGDGRSGCVVWNGFENIDAYSVFTNRTFSIGMLGVCREKSYADIILTDLTIKKMVEAVGGTVPVLTVPTSATSSIKAGEAIAGQASPVLTVEKLNLGAESTLNILPEAGFTKVEIDSVSSAGAAIVADAGAKVVIGGDLTMSSTPEDTGLTLSGDVAFAGNVAIVIPLSWRAYRSGPIVAVDGTDMTSPLSLDTTSISVSGADGKIDSSRYSVSVRNGQLLLDFREGLSIVIR